MNATAQIIRNGMALVRAMANGAKAELTPDDIRTLGQLHMEQSREIGRLRNILSERMGEHTIATTVRQLVEENEALRAALEADSPIAGEK